MIIKIKISTEHESPFLQKLWMRGWTAQTSLAAVNPIRIFFLLFWSFILHPTIGFMLMVEPSPSVNQRSHKL